MSTPSKYQKRLITMPPKYWQLLDELAAEYEERGETTNGTELTRLAVYRFLVAAGKIIPKTPGGGN